VRPRSFGIWISTLGFAIRNLLRVMSKGFSMCKDGGV
jgi:hypothetical protein